MRITFGTEVLESQNISSLKTEITKEYENLEIGTEVSIEKQEGSYFGEWALLGELKDSLSVVAVGEVVCVILTKENFESAVGPLTNLSDDSHKYDTTIFFMLVFVFSSVIFVVGMISCNVFFLLRSRHSSFDLSKESAKVTDTTALAKATLTDLVSNRTLHQS